MRWLITLPAAVSGMWFGESIYRMSGDVEHGIWSGVGGMFMTFAYLIWRPES